MRRVWWVFRIAVLVAASYCIFAPGGSHMLQNARADGCDTTVSCIQDNSPERVCYCPRKTIGGPGCEGCFKRDGETGCGVCSGGPGGPLDQ
jgi:hypothetical protein